MKAVFDALPVDSLWRVKRFKKEGNWSKVWETSEEDWEELEHYMDTEEPRPALTSILIDQIIAWSNAICQWFYSSNIPEQDYSNIFGKELRMRDVFRI